MKVILFFILKFVLPPMLILNLPTSLFSQPEISVPYMIIFYLFAIIIVEGIFIYKNEHHHKVVKHIKRNCKYRNPKHKLSV